VASRGPSARLDCYKFQIHQTINFDNCQQITAIPGRSGLAVSAFACGVRGPRFESHRRRLFSAMATAMYSLGHELRLTAVPRSTQPCIPSGSLNRVPASVGVRAEMSSILGQCDPIRHVSSRSGEAGLLTKGEPLYLYALLYFNVILAIKCTFNFSCMSIAAFLLLFSKKISKSVDLCRSYSLAIQRCELLETMTLHPIGDGSRSKTKS